MLIYIPIVVSFRGDNSVVRDPPAAGDVDTFFSGNENQKDIGVESWQIQ